MKTSQSARMILTGAILSLLITSCSDSSKGIILQREWTANAEYTGDLVASSIASKDGVNLVVREGSELLDPVRLVRVGDAHFGVASADRILQENEGGSQLVIIASATYKSPVVFLSRKDSGIRSPHDFIGKKIGIQSGTNTELVFMALINAVGMDEKQIRVVESGWGIQTFLTGNIDVLGAFDYDETIQLDLSGIEYNVIVPEDYGVHYIGTVYFTRKKFMEEDPETVQTFMDYLVKGWDMTLKNPDESLKLLVSYSPEINAEKELRSLLRGKEYFQGEDHWLLYSSEGRWNSMTESLIKIGRLKSFDHGSNINYGFLEIALSKLENSGHD